MPLLERVHTEFGSMLFERRGFSSDFKTVALLHENNEFGETTPFEVVVVNLANMMTRSIGFSLCENAGVDLAGCALTQTDPWHRCHLPPATASEVEKTMRETPHLF